jgi:hypothetical protein
MTPAEIREKAAEIVARSRQAQGLPGRVEDESTLAKVAALVLGSAVNTR